MIPLRLLLQSFIGIRSGLDKDEIEIDLTALDDAELVAVTGPNGKGKTTLLDNMHPYRIMPSRASCYSIKSFSFYDHTCGEAKKELDWSHDGQSYRSIVVIKGGIKSKKQECYLQVKEGDQYIPVEFDGGLISDGKTDTYDKCVEHILGSPELFFTAAFACQGRKSLADYPNADIKMMMSDLLGLEHLQKMSKDANTVATGAKNKLEAVRTQLNRADSINHELTELDTRLQEETTSLNDTQGRKDAAKTDLDNKNQRLAEAQTANSKEAEIIRQKDSLTTRINEAGNRKATALSDIRTDVEKNKVSIVSAIEDADAEKTRTESTINETQDRITKNEALVARRDELNQASDRIDSLQPMKQEAEDNKGRHQLNVDELVNLEKEREETKGTLKQIQSEGVALKTTCEDLHTRSGLIDEVPCKGTEFQNICQLLAEANKAKDGIPEKEDELTKKREEKETLLAKIDELNNKINGMGDPRQELNNAQAELNNLTEELNKLNQVIALKDSIENAETQLQTDAKSLGPLKELVDSLIEKAVENAEKLSAIAIELHNRLDKASESHDKDIAALESELEALPPTNPEELQQAETDAKDADKIVVDLDFKLANINGVISSTNTRIEDLTKEKEQLSEYVEKAKNLEEDIAQWSLLSRALGKDGIIALCVDDAGPTLTSIANDLLTACYGPRFTVAITTQRETGSGNFKEEFDIRIFDADREDEKSIKDVSGGERIWINEAMTRAIALYQAQSSGRQYGCLFSDESDGALDDEKKIQFGNMKRKVLELGNFNREFFISHSKNVRDIADATIDLNTI